MTILRTGNLFKILQVTGSAGMRMPEHYCTQEAIIIVQLGSAILTMNGIEYALQQDQPFIIPGGENHTLRLTENFQAIVIMKIDSEIKFNKL